MLAETCWGDATASSAVLDVGCELRAVGEYLASVAIHVSFAACDIDAVQALLHMY